MNEIIKNEDQMAYCAPEFEILSLRCSDVITASGMRGAFEGEVHDFESYYGW